MRDAISGLTFIVLLKSTEDAVSFKERAIESAFLRNCGCEDGSVASTTSSERLFAGDIMQIISQLRYDDT